MTPWDWKQVLEAQQPAKDQYDVVVGVLVSRIGMAGNDNHTPHVAELCALISRLWTGDRRVRTQSMWSVRTLSAREAAKGASEHKVVRASAKSSSSLFSASKGSG